MGCSRSDVSQARPVPASKKWKRAFFWSGLKLSCFHTIYSYHNPIIIIIIIINIWWYDQALQDPEPHIPIKGGRKDRRDGWVSSIKPPDLAYISALSILLGAVYYFRQPLKYFCDEYILRPVRKILNGVQPEKSGQIRSSWNQFLAKLPYHFSQTVESPIFILILHVQYF